ncbi:hypothetical protein EX30DRAFT_339967 [Ascodesmis nigricans]|uniref:Uncharacterized protein n=1 Tax=Ascodesmis nigricans TaxID=341454 RepID=A0A4S2MZD1_9PEZI|nr:hypothetical protein EX30DRAFT_339967 [Ascodesmis nigricans]
MPERSEFKRVINVLSFWILSCGPFRRPAKRPVVESAPYPEIPERKGAGTRAWFRRRMQMRERFARRWSEGFRGGVDEDIELSGGVWEEKGKEMDNMPFASVDVGEKTNRSDVGKTAMEKKVAERTEEVRQVEEINDEPPVVKNITEAHLQGTEKRNIKSLKIVTSNLTRPELLSSTSLPSPLKSTSAEIYIHPSLSTPQFHTFPASTSPRPSSRHSTVPLCRSDSPPCARNSILRPVPLDMMYGNTSDLAPALLTSQTTFRPRYYHRHRALTHARIVHQHVFDLFTRADENQNCAIQVHEFHDSTLPLTAPPKNKFQHIREKRRARKQQRRREIGRQHPWYSEIVLTPYRFNSQSSMHNYFRTNMGPVSWRAGSDETLGSSGSICGGFEATTIDEKDEAKSGLWDDVFEIKSSSTASVSPQNPVSPNAKNINLSFFSIPSSPAKLPAPLSPTSPITAPSIRPLSLATQKCSWVVQEMTWMTAPIPTVHERKQVAKDIWRRKQTARCCFGGEDWGLWRMENFVDGHALVKSEGSEMKGDGKQVDDVLGPLWRSSTEVADEMEDGGRKESRRAPSCVSTKPTRLTLDLPDMEHAPAPKQVTAPLYLHRSDTLQKTANKNDDDDSFLTLETSLDAPSDTYSSLWEHCDDGFADGDEDIVEWIALIKEVEDLGVLDEEVIRRKWREWRAWKKRWKKKWREKV